MDKPCIIIFTAPSGAGKTTLVRHLLDIRSDLAFSVSATTRPIRSGELDGKDYYFLSPDEFRKKIANNEFAEWEEVYENRFYGTLHKEIMRLHNAGKAIVFDIDVKGALNLKSVFGDNALSLFIAPPSLEVLIQRLVGRSTESDAELKLRIDKMKEELSYQDQFDIAILNDDLETAKQTVESLVSKFLERCRKTFL